MGSSHVLIGLPNVRDGPNYHRSTCRSYSSRYETEDHDGLNVLRPESGYRILGLIGEYDVTYTPTAICMMKNTNAEKI